MSQANEVTVQMRKLEVNHEVFAHQICHQSASKINRSLLQIKINAIATAADDDGDDDDDSNGDDDNGNGNTNFTNGKKLHF